LFILGQKAFNPSFLTLTTYSSAASSLGGRQENISFFYRVLTTNIFALAFRTLNKGCRDRRLKSFILAFWRPETFRPPTLYSPKKPITFVVD
jgi:hypothetical protein